MYHLTPIKGRLKNRRVGVLMYEGLLRTCDISVFFHIPTDLCTLSICYSKFIYTKYLNWHRRTQRGPVPTHP